jgi:hypothetical protein
VDKVSSRLSTSLDRLDLVGGIGHG